MKEKHEHFHGNLFQNNIFRTACSTRIYPCDFNKVKKSDNEIFMEC